ncbi:putative late blight resistance protein homolog R1B-14 [Vigna radiata var. radiata]|uniref:Late blight resistance protein homolog R1B-14 n=1 Tax=Vigna radiata var. radiata TaxID=3916 RepID=A0A1S3VBE7_VIGRR|nr:putative late blight resistance protein homolog R1B-14 [Vigna radiata var. radiata]
MLAKKEKSHREWCKVVGHVNWYLTRDETQVKDIVLTLNYDNLPSRLKPCFLYLGLFPKDFEIPVTPLLQKWVAEGFIQDTGNRDPDDVAKDYFYELIDRSLVQVTKVKFIGDLRKCQVHDLLRDLCISETKEEKVFDVCTDNNILIPTKPRSLSIHGDMGHYISSSNNDHSCMRSLFFFGPEYYVQRRGWKWLLDDFKLVRVLEFGHNRCLEIPSNLGNFIHLRYLRINSTLATFVPNSILGLWNLQTIDLGILEYDSPISFPIQMWKLKHLRHLNTSRPIKLRGRYSESNEKMWNLQTISPLILNTEATSLIKKGTFPNIKRMGLYLETDGYEGELPNLFQNLQQLKHLNTLMIYNVLNLLTFEVIFPPSITELWLSRIKCITDEGMNGLKNHSKIKILRLLGVEWSENSIDLNCVDGSFPQLEVLEMKHLSLRKFKLGNGAMQRLQNVIIQDCQYLYHLLVEFQSLNGLRKIEITETPLEQLDYFLQILERYHGVQVVRGYYPKMSVIGF